MANASTKSDLGVRTLSAIVMVAVAGVALWFGGWLWLAFVAAVGIGVLYEWSTLARAMTRTRIGALGWAIAGVLYIGLACVVLVLDRSFQWGPGQAAGNLPAILNTVSVILSVIAVDVGAYFAGRAIGGPKIAPAISPGKTWAGLAGGIVGAILALALTSMLAIRLLAPTGMVTPGFGALLVGSVVPGILTAIVAQAGDFFESWMKRRAGVKDSGRLIPGHGGLFDRTDGLIAVCFAYGVIAGVSLLIGMGR